jgi:hypothetical protein
VAGASLIADEPAVAAAVETSQGLTPEIVAVIEAAATQFIGKPVRILSIRLLEEPDADSNVWGSQGRDIIQSSHNLVQRGH